MVVTAQECQHRDEHCKSSGYMYITIMGWHMPAQEYCDASSSSECHIIKWHHTRITTM